MDISRLNHSMAAPSIGQTLEKLLTLFLDGYDRQSLSELLLFKMNQILAHQVSEGENFRAVVFDVISNARREGWLIDLARKARDHRRDRKPEWVGVVAELEAILNPIDDQNQPVL